MLHELLAGTRVFQSALTAAELARHYSDETPPPLRPDVSPEIERLVLELLVKNPADRPGDAARVYERLLPHIVSLPPLPGATAVAPSPNPDRMYATVVGRIARTTLVGPRVPAPDRTPAPRLSQDDLVVARKRAEELAVDGRLSQAVEILEDAVASCSLFASPSAGDPRLLIALRMDLANLRFAARDYTTALDDFEELIPALSAMLGAGHRAVLECRYNQALSSAALGWDEVARDQMTVLLADVRVSPDDHDALTLELRRELCELLVKTGDRERARVDLRALLPDLTAVFGPDHPETRHVRVLLENLDRLGH